MEVWLDEIKCLRVGHQSRDERVSDLSLSANVLIWFCLESRVTNSRAKPQQTPSVEKHAHPPRVVYCAIYPTLTRFTKFRV